MGFYPNEFGFFRGLDVPTNHYCNYEYFNKMHVIMNCHPLENLMIKFQDFQISYFPVLQRWFPLRRFSKMEITKSNLSYFRYSYDQQDCLSRLQFKECRRIHCCTTKTWSSNTATNFLSVVYQFILFRETCYEAFWPYSWNCRSECGINQDTATPPLLPPLLSPLVVPLFCPLFVPLTLLSLPSYSLPVSTLVSFLPSSYSLFLPTLLRLLPSSPSNANFIASLPFFLTY